MANLHRSVSAQPKAEAPQEQDQHPQANDKKNAEAPTPSRVRDLGGDMEAEEDPLNKKEEPTLAQIRDVLLSEMRETKELVSEQKSEVQEMKAQFEAHAKNDKEWKRLAEQHAAANGKTIAEMK